MYLEVDMGNTRTKWRLRSDVEVLLRGSLDTGCGFAPMESDLNVHKNSVHAVWVASVVGDELEDELTKWVSRFFSIAPRFARSSNAVGAVKNGYDYPERLGVDRWLGLLASYRLMGGACVVVSCGTAITVDLLSSDGVHKGGYISPGINLMLKSIGSSARLIHIDEGFLSVGLLPGSSTSAAIFAGVSAMLHGVIENGMRQLSTLGCEAVELILTGGDAKKLMPFYSNARLIPELVLDGLVCVMEHSSLVE